MSFKQWKDRSKSAFLGRRRESGDGESSGEAVTETQWREHGTLDEDGGSEGGKKRDEGH